VRGLYEFVGLNGFEPEKVRMTVRQADTGVSADRWRAATAARRAKPE